MTQYRRTVLPALIGVALCAGVAPQSIAGKQSQTRVAPKTSVATARSPLTAAQMQDERLRIQQTFYVPSPLPPLDIKIYSKFHPAPGVAAERLTYTTEFGMWVPAILYLPDPRPQGALPGLIVIPGHGDDKYTWYSWYAGILYAQAGAAVLTYDPVGEGERNIARRSGTRAHDHWLLPEPQMARRLAGLMLTDVFEGVRVLQQQPAIAPSRIGIMGFSLGSFVTSVACAVDEQIHACVEVGGGDLDGPGGYWDTRTNKPMCQGIPYESLGFLGDRGAMIYALQASHAAGYVFNGLDDEVVEIPHHGPGFFADLQARTARLHGGDEGVFTYGFAPEASHRPWFLTRPVALWLQRQLGFPNWTKTQIEKMPTTLVGAWARARGVPIDPLYDTTLREAGTRALGSDLPAISREDLSVFSADQWRENATRLIYEMWVAHAEEATGKAAKPGGSKRK